MDNSEESRGTWELRDLEDFVSNQLWSRILGEIDIESRSQDNWRQTLDQLELMVPVFDRVASIASIQEVN